MLADQIIVDYGNRKHALTGNKAGRIYSFTKNKKQHLHCGVSPAIMALGEKALSVFGNGTSNLKALDITNSVIALYSHGGFVGMHNDEDRI